MYSELCIEIHGKTCCEVHTEMNTDVYNVVFLIIKKIRIVCILHIAKRTDFTARYIVMCAVGFAVKLFMSPDSVVFSHG